MLTLTLPDDLYDVVAFHLLQTAHHHVDGKGSVSRRDDPIGEQLQARVDPRPQPVNLLLPISCEPQSEFYRLGNVREPDRPAVFLFIKVIAASLNSVLFQCEALSCED